MQQCLGRHNRSVGLALSVVLVAFGGDASMARSPEAAKKASGSVLAPTMAEVKQKIAAMHVVLDSALTPQENLF